MARWIFAFLIASLPALAWSGNFDLNAAVDRNELELGETLQFTLSLTVHGNLTFQPAVAQPSFDGFDAQGPYPSYSSIYINGVPTITSTWVWQLEAKKSGRLVLGPFHATAKDALNGNIDRATQPIVITVRRPQGLNYPTAAPDAQAPAPVDGSLRDIKPDRELPWVPLAEAFGALVGLLGLLAFVAWSNPPKVVEEPMPADPAQAAVLRLDRALQALAVSADGRAYAVAVGEALRQYLRQRLGLRPGLTLGEAVRALRQEAPQVRPREVPALRQRLEMLLYGGSAFTEEDRGFVDLGARELIRGLESARRLSPDQAALQKALERMAELWKQPSQAKSAWMGMRSAVQAHLRSACGPGWRTLPRPRLAAALGTLDAPELLRSLDLVFSDKPPRGADPGELARRLLRLAQAVDSVDKGLLLERGGGPGDGEDEPAPEDEGDQ